MPWFLQIHIPQHKYKAGDTVSGWLNLRVRVRLQSIGLAPLTPYNCFLSKRLLLLARKGFMLRPPQPKTWIATDGLSALPFRSIVALLKGIHLHPRHLSTPILTSLFPSRLWPTTSRTDLVRLCMSSKRHSCRRPRTVTTRTKAAARKER